MFLWMGYRLLLYHVGIDFSVFSFHSLSVAAARGRYRFVVFLETGYRLLLLGGRYRPLCALIGCRSAEFMWGRYQHLCVLADRLSAAPARG